MKINCDAAMLWSLILCSQYNVPVSAIKVDCMQVINWFKKRQYNGEVGHVIEDCVMVMGQLGCSFIEFC